ncbi:IS4 family transposase, partial [Parashewanella curva]
SADAVSEYDFLPNADSLSKCLFMADRGYFKLSYLDSINKADGCYLVRAKATSNPLVLSGVNANGKELKRFKKAKLKDVKKHIRRSQLVDMDVEGKTAYRMIASWPAGKSEPTYWATNLPRDKYPSSAVIKLYSLRWQIELLFKEWKSYNNLRKFSTTNAGIMEGLIWASLLALLVKRRIGFSIQKLMGIDISSFMVAKNTQSWFYQLMESITHDSNSQTRPVWYWVIDYLSKYAKRAHPERDRKTGRLRYGLVSLNP